MIELSDDQNQQPVRTANLSRHILVMLGVVVFVVGIGLMVFVFNQAYIMFQGIDAQVSQVTPATPVATPSSPEPDQGQTVVVATPDTGPSLGEVAASLGLKLLGLLVLGWIAALIATKGIQMATTSGGQQQ